MTPGERQLHRNVEAALPPGQTMAGVRAGWMTNEDGRATYVMEFPCPDCGRIHRGACPPRDYVAELRQARPAERLPELSAPPTWDQPEATGWHAVVIVLGLAAVLIGLVIAVLAIAYGLDAVVNQ